jgi:hypothetical protein
VITNENGQVVKRNDYRAFGDEINPAATGGRTVEYSGDEEVRQQYTSYERDEESKLDYAQARYYNSAHERNSNWRAPTRYIDLFYDICQWLLLTYASRKDYLIKPDRRLKQTRYFSCGFAVKNPEISLQTPAWKLIEN